MLRIYQWLIEAQFKWQLTDLNHLFHAYSFLCSNCNKAKQLFVFTKNLTYLKLICDWFEDISRNRRRKNPPKDPNAFFYTVEASTAVPRNSTFKDADFSLVNYNSEYHYIFSKIHAYKVIQYCHATKPS